jgi:small multidrug resistance family-3 protein
MKWTAGLVLKVFGIFILSCLCEIGGGWLVWQTLRAKKPGWWAVCGCVLLAFYGYSVTLQPLPDFGRLNAAYGGIFIAASFAWARVFDGFRLDTGDIVGSALCLAGALVIVLWPRPNEGMGEDDAGTASVSI